MPANGVMSLKYALEFACWPCCEGCKYAEIDGCAFGNDEADQSVYLKDGYLLCGLWETHRD